MAAKLSPKTTATTSSGTTTAHPVLIKFDNGEPSFIFLSPLELNSDNGSGGSGGRGRGRGRGRRGGGNKISATFISNATNISAPVNISQNVPLLTNLIDHTYVSSKASTITAGEEVRNSSAANRGRGRGRGKKRQAPVEPLPILSTIPQFTKKGKKIRMGLDDYLKVPEIARIFVRRSPDEVYCRACCSTIKATNNDRNKVERHRRSPIHAKCMSIPLVDDDEFGSRIGRRRQLFFDYFFLQVSKSGKYYCGLCEPDPDTVEPRSLAETVQTFGSFDDVQTQDSSPATTTTTIEKRNNHAHKIMQHMQTIKHQERERAALGVSLSALMAENENDHGEMLDPDQLRSAPIVNLRRPPADTEAVRLQVMSDIVKRFPAFEILTKSKIELTNFGEERIVRESKIYCKYCRIQLDPHNYNHQLDRQVRVHIDCKSHRNKVAEIEQRAAKAANSQVATAAASSHESNSLNRKSKLTLNCGGSGYPSVLHGRSPFVIKEPEPKRRFLPLDLAVIGAQTMIENNIALNLDRHAGNDSSESLELDGKIVSIRSLLRGLVELTKRIFNFLRSKIIANTRSAISAIFVDQFRDRFGVYAGSIAVTFDCDSLDSDDHHHRTRIIAARYHFLSMIYIAKRFKGEIVHQTVEQFSDDTMDKICGSGSMLGTVSDRVINLESFGADRGAAQKPGWNTANDAIHFRVICLVIDSAARLAQQLFPSVGEFLHNFHRVLRSRWNVPRRLQPIPTLSNDWWLSAISFQLDNFELIAKLIVQLDEQSSSSSSSCSKISTDTSLPTATKTTSTSRSSSSSSSSNNNNNISEANIISDQRSEDTIQQQVQATETQRDEELNQKVEEETLALAQLLYVVEDSTRHDEIRQQFETLFAILSPIEQCRSKIMNIASTRAALLGAVRDTHRTLIELYNQLASRDDLRFASSSSSSSTCQELQRLITFVQQLEKARESIKDHHHHHHRSNSATNRSIASIVEHRQECSPPPPASRKRRKRDNQEDTNTTTGDDNNNNNISNNNNNNNSNSNSNNKITSPLAHWYSELKKAVPDAMQPATICMYLPCKMNISERQEEEEDAEAEEESGPSEDDEYQEDNGDNADNYEEAEQDGEREITTKIEEITSSNSTEDQQHYHYGDNQQQQNLIATTKRTILIDNSSGQQINYDHAHGHIIIHDHHHHHHHHQGLDDRTNGNEEAQLVQVIVEQRNQPGQIEIDPGSSAHQMIILEAVPTGEANSSEQQRVIFAEDQQPQLSQIETQESDVIVGEEVIVHEEVQEVQEEVQEVHEMQDYNC